MLYNFYTEKQKKSSRALILLLSIIWLLVLRNLLQIYAWERPTPIQVQKKPQPSLHLISLLKAISQLPATTNIIYKIDIHPHEMLLFGKASKAHDLRIWLKYFNHIHLVLKVEVRQWDFIKSGHWRFIIALLY